MGNLEELPYLISWNLTSRCNLLCPHCYMDAGRKSEHELSTEEIKKGMDEIAGLNTRLMMVLTGGEPLLRPDIFDIVEYASEKGFITVMGSNGTLMTAKILHNLKERGLTGIGVSLDSINAANHDAFRCYYGSWGLAVNALKMANDIGLKTQMDVTLTDVNSTEVDALIELGVELSVQAVNFFFLVCTGRARRSYISVGNYESALRTVAVKAAQEQRIMVRLRCAPHVNRILHEEGLSSPTEKGCPAGLSYVRIDPEGNVTPCPYMPVSIGNIRQKPLHVLWDGDDNLGRLRQAQYKGKCGECEYKKVCGGCRARAYTYTKDMFETDPLCAYQPKGGTVLSLADAFVGDLHWDDAARDRINKVPKFMRKMIVKAIEEKARKENSSRITSEFIDRMKKNSAREGRMAGNGGKHFFS